MSSFDRKRARTVMKLPSVRFGGSAVFRIVALNSMYFPISDAELTLNVRTLSGSVGVPTRASSAGPLVSMFSLSYFAP